MATLKCKMCGGKLEVQEEMTVCECEYCGSMQTVPIFDNEKKINLFSRADRLRRACEFDKAYGVYESIVAEFPEEAEAYWGIVLCEYGIEYVDDHETGKKIPTCHRSSFDSVQEDANYKLALEYADVISRKIYIKEAKEIEELRKKILEVSLKEDAYDIFICYKETDYCGNRTIDSVIAQDVYDALVEKGYRVFFSRVTLEDKIGQEYEPYIFAALHSAKIMLVFGSDYEYYDAVWVKNEWERFLHLIEKHLIEKGEKKTLIPCYKGIDVYDIPQELARFQAQDMDKVGAIQDLLRGIEKILPRKKDVQIGVQERIVVGAGNGYNITSLLDRGNMALEDADWEQADHFFEEVLNNDSKNAQAYLGKTLSDEKCNSLNGLIRKREALLSPVKMEKQCLEAANLHIKDAIERFCVPGFVSGKDIRKEYYFDLSYLTAVPCRRRQYRSEEHYWKNHKLLSKAEKFAIGAFAEILFAEKNILFDILSRRIEEAEEAEEISKQEVKENYVRFLEQADEQAKRLYDAGVLQREQCYQELFQIVKSSSDVLELKKAADKFYQMGDYLDSCNLAERCMEKYDKHCERIIEGHRLSSMIKERIIGSPNIKLPLHMGLDTVGQVFLSGKDKYRDKARYWTNIDKLSVGEFHAVAIDRTGKVFSTGDNLYGQCNVSDWTDIVDIKAGGWHTVGLRSDGTVVAVGINEKKECEVYSWRSITKICAGRRHTVGLKSDGTVVATGYDTDGRCNVSNWENIVDIYAYNGQTVGIKDDGTVLTTGRNNYRLDHWNDIISVSMGYQSILGLRKDGTVVVETDSNSILGDFDVSDWTDIVDISVKNCHCAGVRADGRVVTTGTNAQGQCAVQTWKDIVAVSVGDYCTLGIKVDGTVLRAGNSNYQQYEDIYKWKLFEHSYSLEEELEMGPEKWKILQERCGKEVCLHCGGKLKGLFIKKCSSCGRTKDY